MTDNETRGRFAAAMSSGANLDAVIAVHEARVAELQGDVELLTGRAEAAEDAESRLRAVLANVRALADWFDAQPNWREWRIGSQIRAALAPSAEEPTTDQPEGGA